MRKLAPPASGVVHRFRLASRALVGNLPGDPVDRDILVWTPPGWRSGDRLPLLVDLVGYTGSGASHTNWRAFGLSLPERLDRLTGAGRLGPCVVAMPDCFTRWGGNQYINSVGTGRYMDYVCDEVVPEVERTFSCNGQRGVFGKSSGGYGAIVHAMLRPDCWRAAACHSGDAYFEYVYQSHFPILLRELLRFDGDAARYVAHLESKEKLRHDEIDALMTLGMAAHYDPSPVTGWSLPFDRHTGELDPAAWQRWLAWDPVRMVERHTEALRGLRALWIDCGRRDQYHLLWGARMLHRRLDEAGAAHAYHEFDDDHSDVDYRMDESLPYLVRALS